MTPSSSVFFIHEFKTSDSTAIVPGRFKLYPVYNIVEMVTLTGPLTIYTPLSVSSLISAKVLGNVNIIHGINTVFQNHTAELMSSYGSKSSVI
jgi:hypothetical protein